MGLFSSIKNCQKCGKEIGFFTRIKHGFVDENNKVVYYCKECSDKKKEIDNYHNYIEQKNLHNNLYKRNLQIVKFTDEEIANAIKKYNHNENEIIDFLDEEYEVKIKYRRTRR